MFLMVVVRIPFCIKVRASVCPNALPVMPVTPTSAQIRMPVLQPSAQRGHSQVARLNLARLVPQVQSLYLTPIPLFLVTHIFPPEMRQGKYRHSSRRQHARTAQLDSTQPPPQTAPLVVRGLMGLAIRRAKSAL